MCKATNSVGTTELPHYVLFEGKEHHIAENIHGVYHADPHLRTKTEAATNGDSPAENGVEDNKGKGKGQRTPSRPETPSTPVPSAPAPPAKKEPRESRIGINFPTKLSSRVVAAGSKLKLTCYLEGADPSIRWFKNDQPVVYSPKLRQNQLNGLCSLEFTSVTVEDSGLYKCWARNTSGETSTSATLEVFSSGDSADLSPTFTRSLKETYNSKINEINITCHVRAIPKATITWSKDGVTIEPSEKYQLTEHDDGVCELNISDATKNDVSYLSHFSFDTKTNRVNEFLSFRTENTVALLRIAPEKPKPHTLCRFKFVSNGRVCRVYHRSKSLHRLPRQRRPMKKTKDRHGKRKTHHHPEAEDVMHHNHHPIQSSNCSSWPSSTIVRSQLAAKLKSLFMLRDLIHKPVGLKVTVFAISYVFV